MVQMEQRLLGERGIDGEVGEVTAVIALIIGEG